jgi:hypothetical protein
MKDIEAYANSRLAELLADEFKTFTDIDDVISHIEDVEDDFDGESYCPYYSQHEEIIRDYEDDFASEAEDLTSGKEYKAADYLNARADYAYALAWCAFSHYFQTAKDGLVEALEEFETNVQDVFPDVQDVRVLVTSRCTHGWASHDRELEDGTMIFESRQLDGSNGMESHCGSIWFSTCFDPASLSESDEVEAN